MNSRARQTTRKTEQAENLYKPLKDLKGSSAWKGSAGCSLTLLLLNMANFDLKESPWCWIKCKKSIWVNTNHVINIFTLQIDWANTVIYGPPLYQGNTPGAFRTTRSEKHENLFVFLAPQWSQQVNKNRVIKGSTLKRKHSRSSHRTFESSIFLRRKVVAWICDVAEVAPVDTVQRGVVLLNNRGHFLLGLLDQWQLVVGLKAKQLFFESICYL